VLDGLRRNLGSRGLRGRHGVALHGLHLWLGREIGGQRRSPLVLHVRLHLVGVRLGRSVGILRHGVRRHVWLQVGRVLRIVDSRLRHECKAVHLGLGLPGTNWLADHGRTHPPDVVPGRRPGAAHPGLRGVASRSVCGMLHKDAVGNRRRCRWRVVPDMGKWRLAWIVRGEHLRIHALGLGRGAVLILVLFLIGAAVEVGRPLVLVRPTVLSGRVSGDFLGAEGGIVLGLTKVYRVTKSRMSHDEYS